MPKPKVLNDEVVNLALQEVALPMAGIIRSILLDYLTAVEQENTEFIQRANRDLANMGLHTMLLIKPYFTGVGIADVEFRRRMKLKFQREVIEYVDNLDHHHYAEASDES